MEFYLVWDNGVPSGICDKTFWTKAVNKAHKEKWLVSIMADCTEIIDRGRVMVLEVI